MEEGRTEEEWRMRENRGDVRDERLLWETTAQDGIRSTVGGWMGGMKSDGVEGFGFAAILSVHSFNFR